MNFDDNIAKVVERVTITSAAGCMLDKEGKLQVRCVSCLVVKPIDDFGYRLMDNELRNQSYCKVCRKG